MSQYLSGMRKTMEQVVLPSLGDRFAQEQAGIVAATLGFLEQIYDKVFHYELVENHSYKEVLGRALEVLDGAEAGSDVAAALAAVRAHRDLDRPGDDVHLRPYHFVRSSNETMKEQLCELINLQPALSTATRESFDAVLRPFYRELELRERAWVKPLGFDAGAATVPDIDELLYRDGRLQLADGR